MSKALELADDLEKHWNTQAPLAVAAELRRLAAEVEAQRKWINEAIQPLGLYQAYGWSDRMGVIARGRKLLENHHG